MKINKLIKINQQKCFMHRAGPIAGASRGSCLSLQTQLLPNTRSHVTSVVKMKPKSKVTCDLASDDTGKHRHALQEICQEVDCEKKLCVQLCSPLKKTYTKGFFTHKPIAGKFCRFISDIDANNKDDTQYYVKNTNKNKSIDGQKASNYYQSKEMTPDPKMASYIQSPEIFNKIND